MLDAPIRRKTKNYPKDFTPPVGYLTGYQTSNPDVQPPSDKPGHINRISHIRLQQLNKSTQLNQNTLHVEQQTTKNVIITINPEQAGRHFKIDDHEKETPLVNGHIGRKMPYINPQLLNRPRMQDNQDKELTGLDDDDIDQGTPGSIKKNIGLQKPLEQQQPSYIVIPSKQEFSSKKMQTNQNIFYDSLKSQYSNFNNLKQKKLPTFLKSFPSKPESSFRLQRKTDFYSSQSHLHTPKQLSEDKQKARLIQFSGLMEQKHIQKLKSHINNIAFQKSKSKVKPKINITHETQIGDQYGQEYGHSKSRRISRPYSEFQMGEGYYDRTGEHFDSSRIQNRESERRQQKLKVYQNTIGPKTITISYKKTSLNQLQSIYNKIHNSSKVQIQVQIPQILMSLKSNFSRNMQKQDLYESATNLFQSLALPHSNLTIKRYSNCILILSKNICLLWHYDGKVYLGAWAIKYLDEGCKMGLGLEWMPNRYVYYGEFVDNKRNGLGVMKDNQDVYIGEWRMGEKTGNGCVIRNGVVRQNQQHHHERDRMSYDRQTQIDPFL